MTRSDGWTQIKLDDFSFAKLPATEKETFKRRNEKLIAHENCGQRKQFGEDILMKRTLFCLSFS